MNHLIIISGHDGQKRDQYREALTFNPSRTLLDLTSSHQGAEALVSAAEKKALAGMDVVVAAVMWPQIIDCIPMRTRQLVRQGINTHLFWVNSPCDEDYGAPCDRAITRIRDTDPQLWAARLHSGMNECDMLADPQELEAGLPEVPSFLSPPVSPGASLRSRIRAFNRNRARETL
ncbi:hypothetical protein [Nesterenkonia rhizosphaerae]|uniref:Flavodoxin-like domain-containing protein n=1 Tax=Nesterenkonia rhizosphaerae TaxID=1348272 RepID=A0ABP9FZT9_9MICC